MTGTPWSVPEPIEKSRRILVGILVPIFVGRAQQHQAGQLAGMVARGVIEKLRFSFGFFSVPPRTAAIGCGLEYCGDLVMGIFRHQAGSVPVMYRRDAGAPWEASTSHEQTLFEQGLD